MRVALVTLCILLALPACKRDKLNPYLEEMKPRRQFTAYFDKEYQLYQLPGTSYEKSTSGSFRFTPESYEDVALGCGALVSFYPVMGYKPDLMLQYTHTYSADCLYHTADTVWTFAQVAFPNPCINNGAFAMAHVKVKNTTAQPKTFYVKLFYQNTSYWYSTAGDIDLSGTKWLDNYYGQSNERLSITLPAGADTTVLLPYRIGLDPKREYYDPSASPARPGNYEFAVLVTEDTLPALMNNDYWLQKNNPFAEIQRDKLQNNGSVYANNMAYVGPGHFKFVFLEEFFDNTNDLTPNHIYIPKHATEKKLCDTCTGYFKNFVSETWRAGDFFEGGVIDKAGYVKADYGIRRENFEIDNYGIKLKIPGSTYDKQQKTWGEFYFGQSFKYGHLTVRAKFAQMMNKTATPNGIVHNLWLYQRDHDPVDTTNPYSYMRDPLGLQHYEIDFEIWSSVKEEQVWDDDALINYSIVDYMRDTSVGVKPGQEKTIGKYTVDRLNNRQLNLPGKQFDRSFFEHFHTYELIWSPQQVRFLVDGKEEAVITPDMAKIPDAYLFLWIGSPIYQDGTYYSQLKIPFLEKDKQSIINYIKIE